MTFLFKLFWYIIFYIIGVLVGSFLLATIRMNIKYGFGFAKILERKLKINAKKTRSFYIYSCVLLIVINVAVVVLSLLFINKGYLTAVLIGYLITGLSKLRFNSDILYDLLMINLKYYSAEEQLKICKYFYNEFVNKGYKEEFLNALNEVAKTYYIFGYCNIK